MSMWISKSLGGGFRIGTSVRTYPTQAEIACEEKRNFIFSIKNRMKNAILSYLMQEGYFITRLEDLTDLEIEQEVERKIEKSLKEFKEVMRLIDDGGNLTEKRKERLLNAVYGIEDVLTEENALKKLGQHLDDAPPISMALALGYSFLTLLGCFILSIPEEVACFLLSILVPFIFFIVIRKKRNREQIRDNIIHDIRQNAKFVASEIGIGNTVNEVHSIVVKNLFRAFSVFAAFISIFFLVMLWHPAVQNKVFHVYLFTLFGAISYVLWTKKI